MTVIILSSALYYFGRITAFFGIWFFVFVLFVELLLIFAASISVYFRLKSKTYYYYKDFEIAGKKLAIANVILVFIWFVLPLIIPNLQKVFQEAQNLKSVSGAAKYYFDNASNCGTAIVAYFFQFVLTLLIYIYSFLIAWKCEKLGRK